MAGKILELESVLPSFRPSFRPSVCPSFRQFSGNWRISFFSETLYGVEGRYGDVRQSPIFFKKSPSGKNDQKWSKVAQNWGSGIF